MKYPSLVILNSLLDDDYRNRSVAPTLSLIGMGKSAYAYFAGKPTKIDNIQQTWKHFSDSFSKANSLKADKAAAQWVNIMIELGNAAHIFQQASSNPSDSCATLHALRSYVYSVLMQSKEGEQAIQSKITELETQLTAEESNEKNMPQDVVDRKGRMKLADEDIDRISRSLAFLNVIKLKVQELEKLFPRLEYPPEIIRDALPTFAQNSDVKLNQNIPFVFHENYITIYINKIDDNSVEKTANTLFISLEDFIKQREAEFVTKYDVKRFVEENAYIFNPNNASSSPKSASPSLSSTASVANVFSLTTDHSAEPGNDSSVTPVVQQPTPSNDASDSIHRRVTGDNALVSSP